MSDKKENKKKKISDDEKTIKEIVEEENKKNRKHNSRVSIIQFIVLMVVGLFVCFQLFFFVNNMIGFLFTGIFLICISIFVRIASPFNDKLASLNKGLFRSFLVFGIMLTLLSFIFMHTA